MKLIRVVFRSLSIVSNKLAATVAFRLFQRTTSKNKRFRKRELPFYERASRFEVEHEGESVKVYEMGNPNQPTVLLVHGWNSNAGSMMAIANQLVNNGYYVIAPDLPAHGYSKLKSTNLILCSEALRSVMQRLMPQNDLTIIAHSFGSAVVTHVFSNSHFKVNNIIYLSVHNRLMDIFEEYRDMIGLPDRSFELMKEYAREYFKVPVEEFTVRNMLSKVEREKVTIIHDEHDKIIPFSNALSLASEFTDISIHPIENVGHYRMLTNVDVLSMISKILPSKQHKLQFESAV